MVTPKEYNALVRENAPKSSVVVNCAKAFLFGGAICTLGQGIFALLALWLPENDARALTSVSLIALGVLLTALGVYDKIARHAGAGTLVPITGFANAMASSAIEFKSEGLITGTGAKLFAIAGPVIVYGIAGSVLYGAVLWGLHLLGITLF